MEPYRKFAPTPFDSKGAFLDEDKQDWLVIDIMQTRDSDALERSNFECTINELEQLDTERIDHEVHRFGHWGPGWFEIIIVRPDSPAANEAEAIENALADYPVLDEEHFSRTEFDEACEVWVHSSTKERIYAIDRYGEGTSIFAARRDELPQLDISSYLAS